MLQSRGVKYSDVYEARLIVEPPAARLVAVRRHADAPSILRAGIMAEREAQDRQELGKAVARFHAALVSLSGNETLILRSQVLEGIVARHQSQIARRQAVARASSGDRRSFNAAMTSHEKLVEFIEAGDGQGAEAHWRCYREHAARLWLSGEAGAACVAWDRATG